MFIPANAGYTYEAGPEGVEVLEFRNATRFHFLFKNNDEKHWERIADIMKNRTGEWANEPPPIVRQSDRWVNEQACNRKSRTDPR